MIDVALTVAPAGDVIALDVWEGEPMLDGIRALRLEPRRWWLIGAAGKIPALGDTGAVADIGGGLVRATLTGPGWRELLTISAVFDVEDSRFGPGDVASTVIHHVPVRIAPTGEATCEVYFAASYGPTLVELWHKAIDPAMPHP